MSVENDYPVPFPNYKIVPAEPDDDGKHSILVDKRRYRVRFVDETEEKVWVVIEPKN